MSAEPSALSRQPVRPIPHSPSRTPHSLALFLAFLGLYLLTASGHFYAVDEETFYIVTESLGERGSFAVPNGLWGVVSKVRPDGREYAVTGPLQSILALPLYWLGKALRPLFPPDAGGYLTRFTVGLFGSFVTAATVALLYRFARHLGYRARPALGLAALYGLATTAWPHSRTFFGEPLLALGLLLALYGLRRGTATAVEIAADEFAGTRPLPPPAWLVIAGVAMVAAVATKPQGAVALPPLGLYFVWRAAGGQARDWRRFLRAGVAWGAGLALGAIPFALFNLALNGGPFRSGYGDPQASFFSTPFPEGLFGLTLSSGKGILWYAPPTILALAAWWPFARRHAAEALACLGVVAAHLALYSPFVAWHGDGAWGPRYLISALPFALLPLPALLAGWRARRAVRAAVALAATAGIAVQLLGLLVNFDWYILATDEGARHFSPPASPLVGHARLLAERVGEWWGRFAPPPDTASLVGGFSYAEGDRDAGAIFPRWTTGDGALALHPARPEPLTVKLTFFDHRPAALRDRPAVLVNGAALPDAAIERRDFSGTGEGWVYQFVVPADAFARGDARLTLRSGTWNPRQLGLGERDEALGLFVNNVEVWRSGQPLAVRAALAIEPMPRTPRWRFWWFNSDRDPASPRPHLVDHWAWYAAVAGFGRPLTIGWITGLTLAGLLPLLAGLRLLAPALVARPRRRARRSDRQPLGGGVVRGGRHRDSSPG